MRVGRTHILVLLLVVLALEAAGCSSGLTPRWPTFGHKEQSGNLQVQQRLGGQAVDLKADEVVRVMRRIGIPDDEIYTLGSSLRDAMRSTGAAAISHGGPPEVLLAVNDDHLFVQCRSQGSFIYDLKEKRFISVPPMPAER